MIWYCVSWSILTVGNVSLSLSIMVLLSLVKKSQVFPALRHASWPSESSSNGKMDPSSDWGICGHSPLDATKGGRLILQRGIRVFMSLVFPWVCHSNHKVLWQNRAVALSVKHWTDLPWVSSLGMSSVAVRLGPLFKAACWRDFVVTARGAAALLCWSSLTILLKYVKGWTALNSDFTRFFCIYAHANDWQTWPTNWCWRDIVAGF